MMDDYIKRRAALAAVSLGANRHYINEFIKDIPSEDVQPVVRCNDCKYFEPYGHYEGWCHAWSGMTVDDAFCSFGERKDGDADG